MATLAGIGNKGQDRELADKIIAENPNHFLLLLPRNYFFDMFEELSREGSVPIIVVSSSVRICRRMMILVDMSHKDAVKRTIEKRFALVLNYPFCEHPFHLV